MNTVQGPVWVPRWAVGDFTLCSICLHMKVQHKYMKTGGVHAEPITVEVTNERLPEWTINIAPVSDSFQGQNPRDTLDIQWTNKT
jgi:hypothetical protein